MDYSLDALCIQADLIVVRSDLSYAPGQIVIRDGRIEEVGKAQPAAQASAAQIVLHGVALLPGLINAHTHLEFSDMHEPLPAQQGFVEWVGSVLRHRQMRGSQSAHSMSESIALGLAESANCGVAALVDIVTPPWTPRLFQIACERARLLISDPSPSKEHPLLDKKQLEVLQRSLSSAMRLPKVIACLEQLGLTEDRRTALEAWSQSVWPQRSTLPAGVLHDLAVSPHAPYSTPDVTWRRVLQLAGDEQALAAMHIAESAQERQWLDSSDGIMAEMRRRFGVIDDHVPPDLVTSLIDALACSPHGLLIHGNYLTQAEIEHAARFRDRTSVVYCPRTHAHFGHRAYPLEQLLEHNIRVIFGTDSRSSNPDLNIWQEARTALRRHPSLSPKTAFDAITSSAAQAIGLEEQLGSLMPGRLARLNYLPIRDASLAMDEQMRDWFENCKHPIPLVS